MSRELRYGLITGFLTLIWLSCGYLFWMESEMGRYAPFLSMIILVVAIYITILFKRDKDGGGMITFKDSFIAGISVSFVVGLMVGIFLVIYTLYINPDIVNQEIANARKYYEEQKFTPEQIKKGVDGIKASYSAFARLTYGIGTSMLVGTFISLICAAIMRKEKASG